MRGVDDKGHLFVCNSLYKHNTCMNINIRMKHLHTNIHAPIHCAIHTFIYIHIHTHTYIHTRTNTYSNTHNYSAILLCHSGFLVCHSILCLLDSGRKFKWILFYLHRYIRLTPTYAFIMLIYIQVGRVCMRERENK